MPRRSRADDYDIRYIEEPGGTTHATLCDTEGEVVFQKGGYKDPKNARQAVLRWIGLNEPKSAMTDESIPPHIAKFQGEVNRLNRLSDQAGAEADKALAKYQELQVQARGYSAAADELNKIVVDWFNKEERA